MKDPEELLNGHFDGSLAASEAAELRGWLAADREHMRRFVRESVIHSRLRDVLHETDMCGVVYDEALGDMIDPAHIASLLDEEEAIANRRRRESGEAVIDKSPYPFVREANDESKRTREREWLGNALIYASIAAAASLVVMVFRQVPPAPVPNAVPIVAAPAPAPPPIIAKVSNELDATILTGKRQISAGEQLPAGALTIGAGVVELAFTSGVRMVVEGPAELQLISDDRAKLMRGRVVVNVPKQALGFTLHSQAATFVDLGTEFGVEVDPFGVAAIHVLDGEVALVSGDKGKTPSRMLLRGAASKVGAGGVVEDIPFDELRFLRRVPSSAYELALLKSRPLSYWWLDETQGDGVIAGGGRLALPAWLPRTVALTTPSPHAGVAPLRAASFVGEHEGIEIASSKDLGFINNCSCEAWVLPSDQPASAPRRIFSTFDRPHSGLAIGVVNSGWYKLPEDDLRVQLTTYGGYDCISKQPISPDEWVHLVVTLAADGIPTLYVNGEGVEHTFRAAGPSIDFETFEDKPTVWTDSLPEKVGKRSSGKGRIGRNPVGHESPISPECWQGQIGNVAVYDRALSAQEVREHYQATRDSSVDFSRRRP